MEPRSVLHWDFGRYLPVGRPAGRVGEHHPLLLVGIPALLWLLLATTCTDFVRSAGPLWPSPLSAQDQAAYRAENRKLILMDVGAPAGSSLEAVSDVWNTDESDTMVTGVTTTFRLVLPMPATPTVEAWRAAHPDSPGPSAELDAAFDTDVYRPAWGVLDQMTRRLERLGFHHSRANGDGAGSTLQSRTVALTRDGVSVWLGIEYPGGRISVYRNW